MDNLWRGIYNEAEIKTAAKIITNLMRAKKYSLDEALEVADVSEEDRELVVDLVDKELAVSPQ